MSMFIQNMDVPNALSFWAQQASRYTYFKPSTKLHAFIFEDLDVKNSSTVTIL